MAANTSTEKTKEKTEFDPTADASARERLVTARIGLLLKAPFFGNLATRMTLLNADDWCPTAATDGRKFYYNSKFINSLPLKQLEFLVGHEVLHAVYDHIGRRGDREPRLSNIAADFCVNADLLEHRVGERITVVPILYDAKYKGMSFEEVYDDLYQNAPKMSLDQLAEMILDEHLEDGSDGEGGAGDEKNGDGSGKGRPRVSEEERKAIRDEIKEAVLASAQASGAGNLPGGVKRLIQSLTEPVINWRELLQQQIQSTIKSDFSWQRPSRRGWHIDAVLPGMKPGETVDVVVAIDTSGSISADDIKAFLSEVKGIMESYDDYKVRVITWDTQVHNPQEFTTDNMADILSYEPGGGGGTEPHCVWDWLKENEIEPKKLIVFTDYCFYGFKPSEVEDYCETVWIIKGNRNAQPDFGVWAMYEDAK
jgi:predicted metal-dependent peptidase